MPLRVTVSHLLALSRLRASLRTPTRSSRDHSLPNCLSLLPATLHTTATIKTAITSIRTRRPSSFEPTRPPLRASSPSRRHPNLRWISPLLPLESIYLPRSRMIVAFKPLKEEPIRIRPNKIQDSAIIDPVTRPVCLSLLNKSQLQASPRTIPSSIYPFHQQAPSSLPSSTLSPHDLGTQHRLAITHKPRFPAATTPSSSQPEPATTDRHTAFPPATPTVTTRLLAQHSF